MNIFTRSRHVPMYISLGVCNISWTLLLRKAEQVTEARLRCVVATVLKGPAVESS